MMQRESFPDLLRRLSTAHDSDVSTLQTKVQRLEKENHQLESKLKVMSHAFSITMNVPSFSKPAANDPDDYDRDGVKPPSISYTYSPLLKSRGLTSDVVKPLDSMASTRKTESQIRREEGNVPDRCSWCSGSTARPSSAWEAALVAGHVPDMQAEAGMPRSFSAQSLHGAHATSSMRSVSPILRRDSSMPADAIRRCDSSMRADAIRRCAPRAATRPMPSTLAQMIGEFRQHVKEHGASGIAGIGRKFRICDDDGSGCLDKNQIVKACNELGFHFTTEQVQQLIHHFDTGGDGKLEYDEFLDACRPPMNLKRKRLVQKVFELMDRDKSGSLTVNDIKQNFKPQNDPRVASGKMTANQVATHLLETFDVIDHSGQVSVEAFVKYYQGVSASIDQDTFFELMIRNAWHMSGEKGRSENTAVDLSCLKVLVAKSDGSQSVEEIKNDLGVDKSNYQDLLKRLNAQGMTDVVDVISTCNEREAELLIRVAPTRMRRPTSNSDAYEPYVSR